MKFSKAECLSIGSPFSTLQTDHLVRILQLLDTRSVVAFSHTCKQNRDVAISDAVWKVLCHQEWGSESCNQIPHGIIERAGWFGLWSDMATLDSATWREVPQLGPRPNVRASHSMSSVYGSLLIYGGGCDGGRMVRMVSY